MARLDGKVAFITGAARGQGRAHAVRMAQEGADVIAVDALTDVGSVGYPMATQDDMDETVRQVEKLDRRIVARRADVRDSAALEQAVADGVAELGRLDIVVANAGIASFGPAETLTDQMWDDMILQLNPTLAAVSVVVFVIVTVLLLLAERFRRTT